mmetsp:Transcript_15177/g.51256  ORF Transcript_15177/g.51256 Transcript_15177/m.51256 type:complete len:211 (+) Transcript_15177:74-706(+)
MADDVDEDDLAVEQLLGQMVQRVSIGVATEVLEKDVRDTEAFQAACFRRGRAEGTPSWRFRLRGQEEVEAVDASRPGSAAPSEGSRSRPAESAFAKCTSDAALLSGRDPQTQMMQKRLAQIANLKYETLREERRERLEKTRNLGQGQDKPAKEALRPTSSAGTSSTVPGRNGAFRTSGPGGGVHGSGKDARRGSASRAGRRKSDTSSTPP